MRLVLSVWLGLSLLQGCGNGAQGLQYVAGEFPPHVELQGLCQEPRSGINPATGSAFPDAQGSNFLENMWLRSWTNDYYLWYQEVPDVNPAGYTTSDYFQLLKTPATTTTGRPKDRFHFTYPTDAWFALSQGGLVVSYGISFVFRSNVPPRELRVAYVDPNAPTQTLAAQIPRGASVIAIDGINMITANDQGSVDALNAGLFPKQVGETHQFSFSVPGASEPVVVNLVAQVVSSNPVPVVETFNMNDGVIGYIHFTDHYATSELLLFNAFSQMSTAGVTDLVLDLRYNGGGFLDIASEVAYMIAGNTKTASRVFERQRFNDKYPNTNPITQRPTTVMPFHSQSQGFSQGLAINTPLPSLNLNRVFILSSRSTCSASESIINGLRGVDVEVILIGATTCGKPYAFYPRDNCGTTYFSIQIEGVNDKGFGDYPDGFSPQNVQTPTNAVVPGCAVADDFTHDLGDPNEALFAAALQYRSGGSNPTCPTPSKSITAPSHRIQPSLHKPEPMMNRILR